MTTAEVSQAACNMFLWFLRSNNTTNVKIFSPDVMQIYFNNIRNEKTWGFVSVLGVTKNLTILTENKTSIPAIPKTLSSEEGNLNNNNLIRQSGSLIHKHSYYSRIKKKQQPKAQPSHSAGWVVSLLTVIIRCSATYST